MIEIDGSYGEGGGQILRTALSLSCLYKKPFRIFNIRKGRKKPGLMPQHLTSVRAMQLLSGAEVSGAEKDSSELVFGPGAVRGGDFFFDIGTAGSTSLVLQTIIPSLIFSGEETHVTLKGGTHVPFSPPFDYISDVFAWALERMGIRINLKIDSYGFYPKGGGKIIAGIFPSKTIRSLRIEGRGKLLKVTGRSCVANLPLSIAERQATAFKEKVRSEIKDICPIEIESTSVPSFGLGTFIHIYSESENSMAGFTALGERGKRAEKVGEEAADKFIQYYSSGAAFDSHLPDQIVLYLSMADGESVFTTSCIMQHLTTNLHVIGMFHEFDYSIDGKIDEPGTVRILKK